MNHKGELTVYRTRLVSYLAQSALCFVLCALRFALVYHAESIVTGLRISFTVVLL